VTWWSLAHATPMSVCGVHPLAADCAEGPVEAGVVRFRVTCHTESAPPGGPVDTTPESWVTTPVTLWAAGSQVGGPLEPTTRCGPGTFEREGRFVPGMEVVVGSAVRPYDDPLGVLRVGPSPGPASHCFTNPDTCVAAAAQVPAELGPWLRARACHAGDCAATRGDPLTPALREQLEAVCSLFERAPCEVLADAAPGQGWELAALRSRGEGPAAKALSAVQPLVVRAPAVVRWRDGVPTVEPPGAPPSGRSADGGVVATASAAGVEVRDGGGGLVWRWAGAGVQEVDLRADGAQLLVRFPSLVVRVPLDGSTAWLAPQATGFTQEPGWLEGTLLRPDGWPAVGAAVTRCSPPTPQCSARADLLGRFTLPGVASGGDLVHVVGPSWLGDAGADVVVVPGLPARVPERPGALAFVVDDARRVVRASPPLRVGDVVQAVGPLVVTPEGPGAALRGDLLAPLADGWGWVVVRRGGQVVTLP
jgi:hypothetical protein